MKTICFLGDTHYGGKTALWPESNLPADVKKYAGTRYLNKCLDHFIESTPDTIDLLVLMGDLIDGKQRKSDGVGVFTADLGEQVDGAIEGLRPLLLKSKRICRVWGTPYHEEFHNALAAFDREFDIKTVDQVLDIDIDGQILNVAHHPSSGAVLYQGTAVDKEALWSSIAAYEKSVPDARWIIRAHKHNYIMQETRFRTVAITPCWQLPTAHAKKQNYFRFQPSIGGLLMLKDEMHTNGYAFRPVLYDLPPHKILRACEV